MYLTTEAAPGSLRRPIPRPALAHPAPARRSATTPRAEVRVRVANSAHEREAAFRLRYRVYVQELGYRQAHADHVRRVVEEPLDATAEVFVAYADNEVVGTVRSNMGDSGDFGGVAGRYGMVQLGAHYPRRVALTAKLIIDPHYRNGRVFHELAHAVFRLGILRGMVADFIDCEPRLVPIYSRLGYRPASDRPFEHPELGLRVSMRLLADRESLQSVRSPFLRNVR